MSDLHDRAAALAGELIVLKREAALAGDQVLNQALKEVTRSMRQRGAFSEESYARLVERLTQELFDDTLSQERAVQGRKESLVQRVTREVEAEHAAHFQALADQAAAREAAVAERERQASPSYRGRIAVLSAAVALSADQLIRLVA